MLEQYCITLFRHNLQRLVTLSTTETVEVEIEDLEPFV